MLECSNIDGWLCGKQLLNNNVQLIKHILSFMNSNELYKISHLISPEIKILDQIQRNLSFEEYILYISDMSKNIEADIIEITHDREVYTASLNLSVIDNSLSYYSSFTATSTFVIDNGLVIEFRLFFDGTDEDLSYLINLKDQYNDEASIDSWDIKTISDIGLIKLVFSKLHSSVSLYSISELFTSKFRFLSPLRGWLDFDQYVQHMVSVLDNSQLHIESITPKKDHYLLDIVFTIFLNNTKKKSVIISKTKVYIENGLIQKIISSYALTPFQLKHIIENTIPFAKI